MLRRLLTNSKIAAFPVRRDATTREGGKLWEVLVVAHTFDEGKDPCVSAVQMRGQGGRRWIRQGEVCERDSVWESRIDDCMHPRRDERIHGYEAVQQGTETAESTCTRTEGNEYMRVFVLGYILAWCSCAGCLARPVED